MEGAASRRFYSIPKSSDFITCSLETEELESISTGDDNHACVVFTSQDKTRQNNDLLSYVASNIIGSQKTFSGPYGLRTVVYLDFVASGRALKFIEDYITDEVLPEYANTHTTTSITSLQTTLFRHEARDIIRNSCNASEHDSVIFVGSGTTAAVHKLIHSLHLSESPIVFMGPYEHHSNILPWMEAGAEVIRISATSCGQVDIKQLESYLNIFQPFGKMMIGAFSAASNVTGVLTDVDAITVCLHKYGALAFWDYAAAAPYVRIDMNPYLGGDNQGLVSKDAVYFSVHKFVGGVGSPGVLIMKKKLLVNSVPDGCGGGTVFYVRRDHHRYLVEPEMKEEGGTPDLVGAIRAGLVFQLRDAIGTDLIKAQDEEKLSEASTAWKECSNLVILGPEPLSTQRLPIISFLVYHPTTGLFLHHNFVTAVLNDVFGIQARGGCACAGPYAMDVLGMMERVSEKMEELLVEDSRLDRIHLRRIGEYSHREIIRPGFVRINLPYFLDPGGVEFVIEALTLLSQHAWKLLPQYLFNPETGEWRNKQFVTFKDRKWLGHISYSSGEMSYRQPAQVIKGPLPTNHQDCLLKAREIFHQAERTNIKLPDQSLLFDNEARPYRWFLLPSEANVCLQNNWKEPPLSPSKLPFCPPSLLERLGHAAPTMESESETIKIEKIVARLKDRTKPKSTSHDSGVEHSKDDGSPVSVPTRVENLTPNMSGKSDQKEELSCSQNIVTALSRGFCLSENCGDVVDNGRKKNSEDITSTIANTESSDDISNEQLEYESGQESDIQFKTEPKAQRLSNRTEEKTLDIKKASVQEGSVDIRVNEITNSVKNEDLWNESPSCTNSTDDSAAVKNKKEKHASHWFAPPKVIFKPAVQALEEYKMIQDGDQVLVCLSGGKDSLSLLHTVWQYQFYAKKKGISFKFGAVTVDPQTPSYDPSPLKRYLAILGVPYFYESQCIMETANNLPYECASICSFCSRMKRGRIYAAARREGYNVLALGQHLDDLSESFMMSFLHNGSLNTMKAHYVVKEGDLRVIRPFVYVRETDLRNFAEQNQLPVIAENCPACFEAPKERHRTKQLLAAQEVVFPQVYSSMMTALKPLMARGRQSTPRNESGVTSTLSSNSKTDDWDDVDL